jgi:hypothetical protein
MRAQKLPRQPVAKVNKRQEKPISDDRFVCQLDAVADSINRPEFC